MIARARYGHVQAPLAAVLIQRPKVQRHLARIILAVAHAEENDIALVALHHFQILDEEWLRSVFVEEGFDLRLIAPPLLPFRDNGIPLRVTERDNAQRLTGLLR